MKTNDKATLYQGDCLEKLNLIPDNSVDLIIADPPYGITSCHWDSIIPLEPLWKELKRIGKENAAYIFFSVQPFTTTLINSNPTWYRFEWIWNKIGGANFLNLKFQPFKIHENIIVFSKDKNHTYNPIKKMRSPKSLLRHQVGKNGIIKAGKKTNHDSAISHKPKKVRYLSKDGLKSPDSIIEISKYEIGRYELRHPTKKPVMLLEYFIRTYSNPGDTVLDFCMGIGTTGVAALNLGRNFIGIEIVEEYFMLAKERIMKKRLF